MHGPVTSSCQVHTAEGGQKNEKARNTQTTVQNMDLRSAWVPPLQSMHSGTQGGEILLHPGAPGTPATTHSVPGSHGTYPHPTAQAAQAGSAQSQPAGPRGGGGGCHPNPKRRVTHTPVREFEYMGVTHTHTHTENNIGTCCSSGYRSHTQTLLQGKTQGSGSNRNRMVCSRGLAVAVSAVLVGQRACYVGRCSGPHPLPNALNHSRPARPCSFPLSCAAQTGLRLHALEGSRRRGARGVRIVGVYQGPSATSPRTRAPDLGDFKGTLFGGVLMEDLLR